MIDFGGVVVGDSEPDSSNIISRFTRFYDKTGLIPCFWRTIYGIYQKVPAFGVMKTCPSCYQDIVSFFDAAERDTSIISYYLCVCYDGEAIAPVLINKNTANGLWLSIVNNGLIGAAVLCSIEETADGSFYYTKKAGLRKAVRLSDISKLLFLVLDGTIKIVDVISNTAIMPFTYGDMIYYFLPIYFHREATFPSVGMSFCSKFYERKSITINDFEEYIKE